LILLEINDEQHADIVVMMIVRWSSCERQYKQQTGGLPRQERECVMKEDQAKRIALHVHVVPVATGSYYTGS
jgi:hypothetical protein